MTDETELNPGALFVDYEELYPRDEGYSAAEQTTITNLLEEARDAILAFTGNGWETPSGSSRTTNNIQCRVVYRYFENPDAVVSEGVDGMSYSRAGVTGDIDLTDKEKSRLIKLGIVKGQRSGWGAIAFSRGGGVLW